MHLSYIENAKLNTYTHVHIYMCVYAFHKEILGQMCKHIYICMWNKKRLCDCLKMLSSQNCLNKHTLRQQSSWACKMFRARNVFNILPLVWNLLI